MAPEVLRLAHSQVEGFQKSRWLWSALGFAAFPCLFGLTRCAVAFDSPVGLLLESGGQRCAAPNQGHRIFNEQYLNTTLPSGLCSPGDMDFVDLTGDGVLDLVTAEGVFIGHGDGQFGAHATAFTHINSPIVFAHGDFNADGKNDLAVGTKGIRIYFGNGNGTFQLPDGPLSLPFEAGQGSLTLEAQDIDQDGFLDILGTSSLGPVMAYGSRDGAFLQTSALPFLNRAIIRDIDRNNLLDILTIGSHNGFPQYVAVDITEIALDGSFSTTRELRIDNLESPNDFVLGLAVGDINHDGLVDIIAGAGRGKLQIFLGSAQPNTWDPAELLLPIDSFPTALLLRDLDNDNVDDLFVGYLGHAAQIYWGIPDGVDLDSPTIMPYADVANVSALLGFKKAFLRGDANQSSNVDLTDALAILGQLFRGEAVQCGDASDVNDSGAIDITDAISLLGHLFRGGPQPPYPYPSTGGDPTLDVGNGIAQGTGSDLGCSPETFDWLNHAPCFPDDVQTECEFPILQFLDLRVE